MFYTYSNKKVLFLITFETNIILCCQIFNGDTVILSKFRRTRTVSYRTVLHSISSYQTQTAPNYFYNRTRVRRVESKYRNIIKNSALFLKTRVFLKKKH